MQTITEATSLNFSIISLDQALDILRIMILANPNATDNLLTHSDEIAFEIEQTDTYFCEDSISYSITNFRNDYESKDMDITIENLVNNTSIILSCKAEIDGMTSMTEWYLVMIKE